MEALAARLPPCLAARDPASVRPLSFKHDTACIDLLAMRNPLRTPDSGMRAPPARRPVRLVGDATRARTGSVKGKRLRRATHP